MSRFSSIYNDGLSLAFCKVLYRFFDKNGHLKIPHRLRHDNSKECLVMIWGGFNEWHCLAFMTKYMIELFREDVKKRHSYQNVDILIDNIDEDSREQIISVSTLSPYSDNTYFPNHHTWYWITLEIEYKLKGKIDGFAEENKKLKADVLSTQSKKELNRQLREQKAALESEKQAIKAERQALREETPVKSYERSYTGYVYLLKVIGHDSLYKIGRTRTPDNRLKTFNVKLPFPVEYEHLIKTDNMYQLESTLHSRFKTKRKRGSEFFTLTQADIDYIKSL